MLALYNGGSRQTASRALVVRAASEAEQLRQAEYNPGFVLTEYFRYLQPDADPGGYAFWLDVLNNHEAGNYKGMVCAFITSVEYQQRFSAIVSRTKGDCVP